MHTDRLRAGALVAAAACLPLIAPLDAAAQIVNVQPLLGTAESEGLGGEAAGSLDWKTGNIRMLVVGGRGTVRLTRGPSHVFLLMSGRYVSAGGKDFERHVMEHLRFRRDLAGWLGVEGFTQHEFNQFRRLRLRGLLGAGPRVSLQAGRALHAAMGTAYMLEHERLDWALDGQGALLDDAGERATNHRWSSYLSLNAVAGQRFQFTQTVYVQPRFDDLGDLRLLGEAAVRVWVVSRFSLSLSALLAWDRRPPLEVEPFDTAVLLSLEWAFGPIW